MIYLRKELRDRIWNHVFSLFSCFSLIFVLLPANSFANLISWATKLILVAFASVGSIGALATGAAALGFGRLFLECLPFLDLFGETRGATTMFEPFVC